MPMMPFIGVRISWLMLARNSLLARLAASAASLLSRSSLVDPLELGDGPRELLGRCARAWATRPPPPSPRGGGVLPASLLLGQVAFVLAPLGLAELLGLALHLLGLLEEVDEHGDLGSQDLGHDRLEEEVDRADASSPRKTWFRRGGRPSGR